MEEKKVIIEEEYKDYDEDIYDEDSSYLYSYDDDEEDEEFDEFDEDIEEDKDEDEEDEEDETNLSDLFQPVKPVEPTEPEEPEKQTELVQEKTAPKIKGGKRSKIEVSEKDIEGAESIEKYMSLNKEKYNLEHKFIYFEELSVQKSMTESRKDTKAGLVKSIKEVGILTPIHVTITKEYSKYLESGDTDKFKGYKYLLLDGFRRVYNGLKVGLEGCHATVWDFKDKDYGEDFAMIVSAILNKNQKHSMSETWEMIQRVRKGMPIANRTLDSLFQLENGDVNKLSEIMTSEYEDIIESVLSGKKTISQGYNALKKQWDAEDEGERDDKIGVSDYDKEHKIVDEEDEADHDDGKDQSPRKMLSDEEVSEILNKADKYDDEELMDNYSDMLKEPPVETQDTKHRHPLDKDLKAETLHRDDYKCVCCGAGDGLPLKYRLAILQSHHIISVSNGGPDTKDNIITICPNCHTLIHTLLWNDRVFSKEDFMNLPPAEKDRMRKVLKYANIDYEAGSKKGKTGKQIKDDNKNYHKFNMPGVDMRNNEDALKKAGMDLEEEAKKIASLEAEESEDTEDNKNIPEDDDFSGVELKDEEDE